MRGKDGFDYLLEIPDHAELFDQTMTSLAQMTVATVLASYDFAAHRTIVDVGGGEGTMLAAILAAAPRSQGILYDVPRVVETAPKVLRGNKCCRPGAIAEGSFFNSVPGGGDAYVLKNIIHDWADDTALRSCVTFVRRPDPGRPCCSSRWSFENTVRRPRELGGSGDAVEPRFARANPC